MFRVVFDIYKDGKHTNWELIDLEGLDLNAEFKKFKETYGKEEA